MENKIDLRKYAANKLKNLREKSSMTQDELADKLSLKIKKDIKRQTISLYENGDRGMNQDILFAVSDIFDVSINDFFPPTTFDNGTTVDIDDNIRIPIFGIIKAGIPIESQSDIIDYVEIPRSWTRGGKKFYGLKISGDSMETKYFNNDIVIFEQNDDTELYNGKDVAVMINGTESTFKKILVNENGIVLQPYNPAYDLMIFSKEQVENLPIRVVGIAKEKRTKID